MPAFRRAPALPLHVWRLCFGLWLLAATLPPAPALAQSDALPEEPLTIVTANGPRKFTVEVARTQPERSRGLMYRTELALDRGMLFDFGHEQPVSMWMRNTLIPLDMLFVDSEGEVRRIAAETEPLSLESIRSGVPVRAVLELKGGTTRLLNIRPGDRVVHPMFEPAQDGITQPPRTPG